MISLNQYLIFAGILFSLGLTGIVLRRNLLILLMCVELMLNAVNIVAVAFSRYHQNMDGQVMAFFIIILAAAEASIGLGIITALFRNKISVQTNEYQELRDDT